MVGVKMQDAASGVYSSMSVYKNFNFNIGLVFAGPADQLRHPRSVNNCFYDTIGLLHTSLNSLSELLSSLAGVVAIDGTCVLLCLYSFLVAALGNM